MANKWAPNVKKKLFFALDLWKMSTFNYFSLLSNVECSSSICKGD